MNAAACRLVLAAGIVAVAGGSVVSVPSVAPPTTARATSLCAATSHPIGSVAFLPDRDESEPGVRYGFGRGSSSVGITPGAAVFAQHSADSTSEEPKFATFRMDVVAGGTAATLRGESPCAWRTNVYRGEDPSAWREGVPNYARVRSSGVLPGVDVVYRAEGRRVAFDFEVAPGADPSRIAVAFAVGDDRAPAVRIDDDGSLVVASGAESMRFGAPVVYQDGENGRAPVTGAYALRRAEDGRTEVAFEVGDYDRSLALVIDPPSLGSASYLGGTGNDNAIAAALGKNGEVFVAGLTTAPFFATNNFLGGTTGGQYDGFVAQIADDGAVLANAVIGSSATDYLYDLTVEPVSGDVFACGVAFVIGQAASNFPTTAGTYAGPGGASNKGFIVRMTPALTLVASAAAQFERGMFFHGVSVAEGHVAVACETPSRNLPTTLQSAHPVYPVDAFGGVAAALVLSDDLTTLQAATYVGEANGRAYDCIYKDNGNLVVVGLTTGASLPVVNAPQATAGGGTDGWWAEYDGGLTTVQVCTYVGGPGFDLLQKLAKPTNDPALASFAGDVFAAGACSALPSLALTTGAFHGGNDILVCAIRPNAAPLVTCIGGGGNELPTAMVFAGGGFLTLGYTDSFGDYTLIEELGPGGGGSDVCLNAFEVTGTSLTADADLNGIRWGGSGGDPSGGLVVRPKGVAKRKSIGGLLGIFACSTTPAGDFISTNGSVNDSDGDAADDGICVSFELGADCPKPPKPSNLQIISMKLIDGPSQDYEVFFVWDADPRTVPPITGYQITYQKLDGSDIPSEFELSLEHFGTQKKGSYTESASLSVGAHCITLRAVNDCGVSDPAEVEAWVPDPEFARIAVDPKTASINVSIGNASDSDIFLTCAAVGTMPKLDEAGTIEIIQIRSVLTDFKVLRLKKPKPTETFALTGTIRIPAGSKTGLLQLSNAGLTVPVKFKFSASLNGKTKSVKFTLKPPK